MVLCLTKQREEGNTGNINIMNLIKLQVKVQLQPLEQFDKFKHCLF